MATPRKKDWLQAYAQVQRAADSDVLALLQASLRDLNRTIKALPRSDRIGRAVREQQLQTVKRELLRQQAEIFRKAGNVIRTRRLEAASRAVALGTSIDDVLFRAAGDSAMAARLKVGLTRGLESTMESAMARLTGNAAPLSERVYKTRAWLDGRVNRKVNSALARGLTAKEFAAEARDWISPNTPGGVRYAAMRLARSEINNGFHAVSAQQMQKPWVTAVDWNLSGSHPKPDICNKLHDDGPYEKGKIPSKPHPHCFCCITPVVQKRDAFLDDLVGGKYDEYLDATVQ